MFFGFFIQSVRMLLVFLGLTGLMSSCGRSKQKVDIGVGSTMSSGTLDVSDPNCKKAACPKVEFQLVDDSNKDLSQETLTGSVGVEVNWKFQVKSEATPGRIRIALVEAPIWLTSAAGAEPGSIVASGKPTETATNASFVVLARDIGRCKAMEKVTKSCADVKTPFEAYDKLFNIKFSITGN
jgi:hypothetical protein